MSDERFEAAGSAAPAVRPPDPDPQAVPAGRLGTLLLGLGLMLTGLLTVWALIGLWPYVERAYGPDPPAPQRLALLAGAVRLTVTPDTVLLLLFLLASTLGCFVHAATSFSTYVGNRRLNRSWFWWYVLRMVIGAALAVLFYFAVRGGLLSTQADSRTVNPYGVAALAALVGLFSKQATDKLREVFETLFRTAPGHGDDERKDKAANPRPRLLAVEPARIPVGSGTVVLNLQGQGLIASSVAQVSHSGRPGGPAIPRRTTRMSATEIRVELDADDLTETGQIRLTVVNPGPGGGESNALLLDVHDLPATGAPGS